MPLQVHQRARSCLRWLKEAAGRSAVLRLVVRLFVRWSEIGTAGYTPEEQRRLKILNVFIAFVMSANASYVVQNAFLDYERYKPVILINAVVTGVVAFLPLLHRFGAIAAGLALVACEYAALISLSAYLGRHAGLQLQFFIAAAATFVIMGPERLRLVLAIIAAGLALHLIVWFHFPPEAALLMVDQDLADGLYLQAAIVTMAMITATVWYAFGLVEKARGETEALLRNILPGTIVERLKAEPDAPIADTFEVASVMFADIKGFVPLARKLGAHGIVGLLNRLVSAFDELAAQHGVEKIKTIGDAYMAAAGVPTPAPDHAERLVRLGLDMQALLAGVRSETGLDIQIRVGIASGPLMAGIIGRNKFSYDVWGDTVNLASRLEGRAAPGGILVCKACRGLVEHRFELESLGTIAVAGIGESEVWRVIGERPVLSTGLVEGARWRPGEAVPSQSPAQAGSAGLPAILRN